jgi:hypothetical protein
MWRIVTPRNKPPSTPRSWQNGVMSKGLFGSRSSVCARRGCELEICYSGGSRTCNRSVNCGGQFATLRRARRLWRARNCAIQRRESENLAYP